VTYLDRYLDKAAIFTAAGEYTIVNAAQISTFNLGDIVQGPLESLGSKDLRNLTQSRLVSVFVEDICCDLNRVKELFSP